jgi:hypothetical protein
MAREPVKSDHDRTKTEISFAQVTDSTSIEREIAIAANTGKDSESKLRTKASKINSLREKAGVYLNRSLAEIDNLHWYLEPHTILDDGVKLVDEVFPIDTNNTQPFSTFNILSRAAKAFDDPRIRSIDKLPQDVIEHRLSIVNYSEPSTQDAEFIDVLLNLAAHNAELRSDFWKNRMMEISNYQRRKIGFTVTSTAASKPVRDRANHLDQQLGL